MSLFSQKRALTPLVATILLVAFSVGLGALVMSWGEEYIEEKAEFVQGTAEIKSGCDATILEIIRISGQPQLCSTGNTIQIWLDNGPDSDIFNIHARIAGTNDVQSVESILAQPLLKSNAAKTEIPYNPAIGQIQQIKLTPKIWTGTDVAVCAQASLTVERIPSC